MTLAGLTVGLVNHLAVVNLRLALLEGSEPQAAATAALDLVKRLLLEAGMGEQEAEVVLVSARQLVETVLEHL
ncbi:hypothetical protein [Deinococcus sp.]|uniref:hypothetical protein n=1 Tax=Deinococcus sp. TaxID=47478 RepID=UPI003C79A70A